VNIVPLFLTCHFKEKIMAVIKTVPAQYATKGDTITATYTQATSVLMALYIDSENKYIYAVDDKQVIRKMSITRDVEYARKQFRIAKKLVNKSVRFGVTSGWNSDVWFNEIIEA
jgi:hypothetical protein